MEDTNTYRVPEEFNPWNSADAIRGLVDAVHQFHLEGPGTQRVIPFGDKAGLNALIELLQVEAHTLHDYLHEIANSTTLSLPLTDNEFDAINYGCNRNKVKEPAALYSFDNSPH